MVKSVRQAFNLLLTLLDFTVQLVTIALEFFPLLRSFDNVVSLRVLSWGLSLTTRRFVLLNESFEFDSQVLHLVLSLLKLNSYFVSLLLSCLLFRHEDVLVHLDFTFTLFHRHFQLILPVFQSVH